MTRVAVALLYLAALAGGSYVAFRPTFDSHFARVQTETGDGMLNHYILEHTWRAVADPGYCGTLASPPFFYPERHVLWYSETLLGVAPLYWALRLGLPPDLAYQWWQIACAGLNFVTFALVARWLGCGHLLAAFGAYLWAFAVVHLDQAMHQQLIPRFWMPPAVYYFWRFAAAPGTRPLNRGLACLYLQSAACVYTSWFLAVGLAVFVPVAVRLQPDRGNELLRFVFVRENRWPVLRVVGLWGFALILFFAPYLWVNRGISRDYDECVDLLPTVAGWFTSPGGWWVETLRPHLRPVDVECRLFSGFALYALFAAAAAHAWLSRRNPDRPPELRFVAACLVAAGVWWLLTLNYGFNLSPWAGVRFVPGGKAIRCVGRVYVIVYLFGTLAAVAWLKYVLGRIADARLRVLLLAAVAVSVLVEQVAYVPRSVPKAEFYPVAERCAAGLRGADAGYVVPSYGPGRLHGDVLGMWAGLMANVPVVNGYSGRYPANYPEGVDDEPLRDWLRGRFRGRVVVVDPHHPSAARVVVIE